PAKRWLRRVARADVQARRLPLGTRSRGTACPRSPRTDSPSPRRPGERKNPKELTRGEEDASGHFRRRWYCSFRIHFWVERSGCAVVSDREFMRFENRNEHPQFFS